MLSATARNALLIQNVVTPVYLKELINDVGDSPYSLIVDEVTDNSASKFMGACVRYYSKIHREMITDFLGLIQVTGCKGIELANAMKGHLASIGLPLLNLQAVGVDGAPAMCGQYNSFYTHMKEDVPHLMLFKCVCHSIDKCAEHAFKILPDELSNLMADTSNWFAHSAKRWDEYSQYYEVMSVN